MTDRHRAGPEAEARAEHTAAHPRPIHRIGRDLELLVLSWQDLRAEFTRLYDDNGLLRERHREHTHAMLDVQAQLKRLQLDRAELRQAVGDRDRETQRLMTEIEQLRVEGLDLRGQIDKLTAERLAQSDDLSSAADAGHLDVMNRLHAFDTQELPCLVRPLAQSGSHHPPQRRTGVLILRAYLLILIAGIDSAAELLNQLGIPTPHTALLADAEWVCARGADLRRAAEELDNSAGWMFDRSSRVLDIETQRAWRACDPNHPVQFVVVPGYRAGRRLYRQQEVFTGEPSTYVG
ncbi:hypothetical protein DFR70_1011120 [Nocardia tenerifensis]|uniref:Uncharacterized protein n=1 Tax=Nocardia tenerifensis TaxID=228006 RepID=A0A318KC33_9NOCA|nr:hypothetical protein [Nocardia tenerifensis]PXX71686.1 hypothetical protein DFR70_1011120 [Nocardia tenerifensis]